MIKRNDLAKQFELVVQQEIKNHNDQMLATNLALNDVRKLSLDQKNFQESVNNAFGSEITKINIKLVELTEITLEISRKLKSCIQDSKDFQEKAKSEIQLAITNGMLAHSKIEKSFALSYDISNKADNIKESVAALINYFTREIGDFAKKIRKEITESKQEILALPSEAQKVKNDLEAKMSIDRVDFEGVMRELQLTKRDSLIKEKKIEKLFILIERLEKRIKP